MNKNGRNWIQLTLEEQFTLASAKFSHYACLGHCGKCRKWSRRLVHAAFTLHPELREDGSLERYFVAKLGRERGYRGAELTAFVDRAYESGLAKLAIEAGMASGPRLTGDSLQVHHASEPGSDTGNSPGRGGASIPSFFPPPPAIRRELPRLSTGAPKSA